MDLHEFPSLLLPKPLPETMIFKIAINLTGKMDVKKIVNFCYEIGFGVLVLLL